MSYLHAAVQTMPIWEELSLKNVDVNSTGHRDIKHKFYIKYKKIFVVFLRYFSS